MRSARARSAGLSTSIAASAKGRSTAPTATPSSLSRFLPEWLARGYGGPSDGPLAYVARRVDERVDPGLLFEGAKHGTGSAAAMNYDATILVWVPTEVQLERTVARDGCDTAEAQRRIDAQMSIDEKRALADYVIDNSGTPEETAEQVGKVFDELTKQAD